MDLINQFIHMKKVIILSALLLLVDLSFAGDFNPGEDGQLIAAVETEMIAEGTDLETIKTIFGDDNLYFPKNEEELDLSYYVIDKIIENGQVQDDRRNELRELSLKAYNLYLKKKNYYDQSQIQSR